MAGGRPGCWSSAPERPYPGLEAFQESDAAVFFGRDDETDRRGAVHFNERNLTFVAINERMWAAGTDENGDPVTFHMIAA